MNQPQSDFWEQSPNQQQSLGDVQVHGDGNVFNSIQGRDVQVYNLNVHNRLLEGLGHSSTVRSLTEKDYRFRKVLLNKVKKYWIQDVLERSLHEKVLIELGLEERLDAVKDAFNGLQLIPEESKRSLLETNNVVEVFHQLGEGRTLLILGEPGAGKTITLLRMARDLIARSEQDLSQPIPVVLNLSSWAVKQKSLAVWLIEELSGKYQVSKSLGKTWIAGQQLLLLLDGLDEVKAERREACLQTLNQFMQEYGQTEIVVCSRLRDYEALANRLQLQAAIYIQSLTPEQVSLYLERAGDQLKTLRILLQSDEILQELAQSPLMLSVMSVAYQHKTPEEIPHKGTLEESRQHLFDTYIQRMFRHRSGDIKRYPEAKMMHWLVKLAQQMSRGSQTFFLIERMQPDWLVSLNQVIIYRGGLVFIGFIIGSLASGVCGGLVGGLRSGSGDGLSLHLVSNLHWNLQDSLKWLWVGAFCGGVMNALIVGLGKGIIEPVEIIKFSWKEFFKNLFSSYTLGKGIIGGILGALGFGLSVGLENSLSSRILLGSFLGLVFGLFIGVSIGFKGAEIESRTRPNQGIRQSAINACFSGLSLGVIGGLMGGAAFAVQGKQNFEVGEYSVLIGCLSGSVHFASLGGLLSEAGKACQRHLILRTTLRFYRFTPWNYSAFLDHATEYVFLQKVGGGYIFMHRMLLEHFARKSLEEENG